MYSRPDFTKINELLEKRITRAVLNLPDYSIGNATLKAFKVSARFCSFGSTWENKIPAAYYVADSIQSSGYQRIDITSLVTDPVRETLTYLEGLILKKKESGFSAVATGDSCYAPLILEVNYW